ncbi:A/G-specific adenine glycosylase [Blattabacterium cuenoti]|uniref:A/G-specific adenine glycosylase n=1 Tax=Blattabacterium cuenoti TaxID=1653831 RepID=UPI00163CD9A3|nr:A/G-specific adenine glycosylase [Blattabacterium cuenoti]
MNFSNKIMNWYSKNKRNLPWRKTINPFHILISELMLQQTRVSHVVKYYSNFIQKFPTIEKVAESSEKNILKEWKGLGYYFRAKNLYNFAKLIYKKKFFPDRYHKLIKFKGIGPYTAAAVSSICFSEIVPAIDCNVVRVFSRYFGIHYDISKSLDRTNLSIMIKKIMDVKYPGLFNQAIMDLGATLCTFKKYQCFSCPINDFCFSKNNNVVDQFPKKNKKK